MKRHAAVFVAYHRPAPIFASKVFLPLHVGAANADWHESLMRDDNGDNISSKNPLYCELTGLYWIWRNYIPVHADLGVVGLCHYRRFLDPFSPPRGGGPFREMTFRCFNKRFGQWTDQALELALQRADVLLPTPIDLRKAWWWDHHHETVYSHLVRDNHKTELDALLKQLSEKSHLQKQAVQKVFGGFKFHCCLTFAMRRDLFDDFAQWMFEVLFEMESHPDASVRKAFSKSRTPGYLAERLFDVWLSLHPEASVMECDSFFLTEHRHSLYSWLRPRLHRLRHPPIDARNYPLPDDFR